MSGAVPNPWRAAAVALALLAGGSTLSACADDPARAAEASEIRLLDANAVPAQLAGLRVAEEDASMVKGRKRPFVEAVGLYSLRDGETLQATLQLSRFTKAADVDDEGFQRQVVQQVGSTTPQQLRVGDHTVYLTTGRRQQVAVWFQGRTLFILGVREEYPTPRALLREALEIRP